jgi:hypothetical protein
MMRGVVDAFGMFDEFSFESDPQQDDFLNWAGAASTSSANPNYLLMASIPSQTSSNLQKIDTLCSLLFKH